MVYVGGLYTTYLDTRDHTWPDNAAARMYAFSSNRCQHTPSCSDAWNENPIGIMSRREDNTFSMCKPCFWQVKRQHEAVASGAVKFDFSNPNANKTLSQEPHGTINMDSAKIDILRAQHENETFDRIRWCLDHNLTPAHEHVHLAPGDDSKFMV